jgi:hypothetical protein
MVTSLYVRSATLEQKSPARILGKPIAAAASVSTHTTIRHVIPNAPRTQ